MQLAIRSNLNFYRLVPLALMLWPTASAISDYALSPLFLQSAIPLEGFAIALEPIYLSKGDHIAGYEVSSDYDLARVHPVSGRVEPHYGVDVATPTGTKLIAPTLIEVRCWYDINGGGEVAEVTPAEGDAMKLLHLSTCVDGRYKSGDTFALTGSSGIGTGAHLDARRADKAEPSKQDIEPYLTGKLSSPSVTELSDRDLTCSIGAAEGTRDGVVQPKVTLSSQCLNERLRDRIGWLSPVPPLITQYEFQPFHRRQLIAHSPPRHRHTSAIALATY